MWQLSSLWYHKNYVAWILLPFSAIYRCVIFLRHRLYQYGLFKSHRLPVPVIIVGNLTVGGTGKTPLLMALVTLLQQQGFNPGVISRGYGGKASSWPQPVLAASDPIMVGDEAVLIAKNTHVPVFVGSKRVDAAKQLLSAHPACNVILSDDGLQHYALQRDIEIAVIDGLRRFGSGYCLPAGPLREPINRLKIVDFVVCNGEAKLGEYSMTFVLDAIVNVADETKVLSFSDLQNKPIIAIAGIGHPERFFQALHAKGLSFKTRIFPDHHCFQAKDIACAPNEIVIMTEKDAIKCTPFANQCHWSVKGRVVLDPVFERLVVERVNQLTDESAPSSKME